MNAVDDIECKYILQIGILLLKLFRQLDVIEKRWDT